MPSKNEESAPLLEPVAKRKRKGNVGSRYIIAGFLAVMIVFTIFNNIRSQHATTDLKNQLEEVLEKQNQMMKRFNTSITNTDVVNKVNELESDLRTTEADMNDKLFITTHHISVLLNKTVDDLNKDIKLARTEIHNEVVQVESDIGKYQEATKDQFDTENAFMIWQLAGTFTLLGCLISMWHMTDHLRNMYAPDVQRKVLAILWMSPIYSITSWFGLVFSNTEEYLSFIKDLYEAYCIYTFLAFIIAVIGRGDRETVVTKLALHADHLTPPIQFFGYPSYEGTAREKAETVLMQCQVFSMQFVFFHPFTSVVKFVCNENDFYGWGDSSSDWRSPQLYMTIIDNVSMFMAFSGLLKTYHVVHHELEWYRPLPKFLCIKGVVFMTFWQGLVINIMGKISGSETSDDWATRTQSFLICLEMLGFSIAHFYTFPVEEWKPDYRPKAKDGKFGDNMALGDFLSDLRLVMGSKGKKKQKYTDISTSVVTAEEIDEEEAEEVTERLRAMSVSDGISPQARNASKRLLSSGILDAMENGEEDNGK